MDDTPDLMSLAAVGITTREACGNAVRNVTGCPLAGVARPSPLIPPPTPKPSSSFCLATKMPKTLVVR